MSGTIDHAQRVIRRLTREIEVIENYFYDVPDSDPWQVAFMLERKRDDIVRGTVLQLHTAIEQLLNGLITCRVLGVKSEHRAKPRGSAARALVRMLSGGGSIGFEMKLNFAVALRILTTKTKDRLVELNRVRNRCSHNWILRQSVRRGRRPAQKKPPLLEFRGKDLHKVTVFKEFCAEYGLMHANLWLKLP